MAKARGKYAHVIEGLPRTFGEEPAYQDKVDAVKKAMSEDPLFQKTPGWLAEEYASVRDEKVVAEAVVSEINLRQTALEQMMMDKFDEEAIESIRTESGLVSYVKEPDAKVIDKEAYRRWCDSNPDLRLRMMLPSMTTKSLAKERLINGDPAPPGVEIEVLRKVRFNQA